MDGRRKGFWPRNTCFVVVGGMAPVLGSKGSSLTIALPNRVQDKRLAIELSAMHQSYFEEDRRTWDLNESDGDRLEWIATRMIGRLSCKVDETDFPAEGTRRRVC